MRRIALVCDWFSPRRGGIESHLGGLATHLVARGYDVRIITSTPGPADFNGIPVHRLAVPRIPLAGVAALPVAIAIQQILVAERIDIVHNHVSIVAPVALGGGLAAHRAGLPSVMTFHSFVPATPLLAGIVGAAMGAGDWRAIMTAVSGRVVREVQAFSPSVTFSLLPNAIDTSFWTPGPDGDGRTIRLVFAGRLQPKKRPLLLLRVLRELSRVAGERNWSLVVAGEGPLEKRLREGVRELGIDGRVHFAGWTSTDALREIYRTSDVFLSTATRESFGLAALEARATGLPVVAVRDSAVADFITHEESGLLADNDDAFASAAARLVLDDDLRRRIAAYSRAATVPFDWNNTLALHERAYENATALARSGRRD